MESKHTSQLDNFDLKTHYANLLDNACQYIFANNCQPDDFLNSGNDFRRGLTLILRPSTEIKNQIQLFLQQLIAKEPHQYYYPNTDIHLTLLSVITCNNSFNLSGIDITQYVDVVQQSLPKSQPIEIEFKGVTASPSCIMIAGYPLTTALNNLRNKLRQAFKSSNLHQTIDARYTIQTAHLTVARFRKPLQQPKNFIDQLQTYTNLNFGTCLFNRVELVANDWYMNHENVKILHGFDI